LANTAVVYDRQYGDYTLHFEASGGLLHDTLVLQDKETDSYWSIIKGLSIAGELAETSLKELPIGTKLRWQEWVSLYPDTRVLSVDGREHYPVNPYQGYLDSEEGFGGRVVSDERLATKEPVFGFVLDGVAFAVPLRAVTGGAVFEIDSSYVFFFRPVDSQVIRSTVAYISSAGGFTRSGESWTHSDSKAVFDTSRGFFVGGDPPELKRMEGFDTFWYTWSPLHPETKILRDSTSP
jgi:hypothetical protein